MDEREKMRKFRELDDAFAEALRELDSPDCQWEIPTGPPVRPLAEQEAEEDQARRVDEAARQQDFEARLKALMNDYHLPAEQVADLLTTLHKLGRIA